MTRSVDDFKYELGRELAAAAHRRYAQPAPVPGGSWGKFGRFAAAGALAVVAILAAVSLPLLLQPQKAEANALAVTVLEDEIELRVVDIVADPEGETRRLADEHGLDVKFVAEPAEEQLVGYIVSALVLRGGRIEFEADDLGRVDRIILPRGFSSQLEVYYGRAAEEGETYSTTTSSVVCADFFGQTPGQSIDGVMNLASVVRIHAFSNDGEGMLDIEPDAVPASYRLADIMFLSDDSVLVTYAEDPFNAPVHPNCR